MISYSTGITNYEEYSLIQEQVEEKREDGMGTLKKDRTLLRDERKMEKLKAKLHTDDDCEAPDNCEKNMSKQKQTAPPDLHTLRDSYTGLKKLYTVQIFY